MKRIALALFFAVFACCTAQAQSTTRTQAQAVATCGGQSLTAGVFFPVTQDLTGALCTNASGGGGGGSVTQGTVPWVVSNAGTFAVQAATTGAVNTTLTDCSGTIAAGATAQNAFTASATRHGFIIANIDTTEVMWINFTGTAAASGTASYPLAPADTVTFSSLNSFASPLGMGINTALSVIAATTAHKYSCTVW